MSAKVWEDPKTGKFYVKVNDKRLPKGRKAYLMKSESEARTECKRLNKMLRDGSFQFDSAPAREEDCETLKEYFEKFCKMQKGAFAARTLESYEGNFKNHVLPVLGAMKVERDHPRRRRGLRFGTGDEEEARKSIDSNYLCGIMRRLQPCDRTRKDRFESGAQVDEDLQAREESWRDPATE